jgi:hypothetical protein
MELPYALVGQLHLPAAGIPGFISRAVGLWAKAEPEASGSALFYKQIVRGYFFVPGKRRFSYSMFRTDRF